MAKRFLPYIGILLLLPFTASASMPLYERMKAEVEEEAAMQETSGMATGEGDLGVNASIVPFIQKVFEPTWKMTEQDVQTVLRGGSPEICGNAKPDALIKNLVGCAEMKEAVRRLAQDEARIQNAGKILQAAATSYELPISDLPGRALRLASDLRGILSIWSAGTGSVKSSTNAPAIRYKTIDKDAFRPLLTNVGEELETMKGEQLNAAVWRYQYGVRLVRGERAPRFPTPPSDGLSGEGTERQYIFKRWPALEESLRAIWDKIQSDTFNPPLSSTESAYYNIPVELLDATMPDNVIIWMRMDGDPSHVYGDVGLQWDVATDPIMPSLMTENGVRAILGGDFPPEPSRLDGGKLQDLDGAGLCTSPSALRGYLCRPFVVLPPEERCPVTPGQKLDEFQLVHCINPAEDTNSITAAGADVCRDIAWEDSKPFDINTQCKIAMRCAESCPGASAQALLKNSQGVIEICMSNNPPGPATYLFYHELVHAYQNCNQPPSNNPTQHYEGMTPQEANGACCRWEGEAYRMQCDLMERDGVFDNASGFGGIPFNAETCAELFANDACSQGELKGCYTSRNYPEGFRNALLTHLDSNNPKNVPDACKDAIDINTMDPRVKALKEFTEARDDVCAPGYVSSYPNRIGNNACYIGQCVEQTVELHRIMGGRTPAGINDEIAPWDEPAAGTPLGNILLNPPITQTRIPTYRPELLMRQLETALCQLQGLPPQTPPILCAIAANRQLDPARLFGAEVAEGLISQTSEQELSTEDLLSLSPAVGVRMGTTMYGNYFRESNRSFADILSTANRLLQEINKISFPTEMCPAGTGLPAANRIQ